MAIGDVGGNNSTRKPSAPFITKALYIMGVMGVGTGVRYAINTASTSVGIESRSLSGSGWDGARTEVTNRLRASLQTNLGDVRLTQPSFDALLNCEVAEQIKWLNTTGCAYEYNTATTSMADHIREQDACLAKAGVAAKAAEIDVVCSKQHIPNSWAMYEYLFAKSFASGLTKKNVDPAIAQTIGECVSKKYIKEVEATGCKPMNLNATTSDGLFGGQDVCLAEHQSKLDKKMDKFSDECIKTAH